MTHHDSAPRSTSVGVFDEYPVRCESAADGYESVQSATDLAPDVGGWFPGPGSTSTPIRGTTLNRKGAQCV